MSDGWQKLRDELKHWQDAGKVIPFWWRDDDAVQPTAALSRLAELSGAVEIPVHLAVIPKYATPELAANILKSSNFLPLIHGFAHDNHAETGQKKSEFGDGRGTAEIGADLRVAIEKMQSLFGDDLCLMFVPPWNRISVSALEILEQFGLRAVSTFTPRKQLFAVGRVEQINTHIDPIDWHGTRSVHPPEMLLEHAVKLLRDRRLGKSDTAEPLGYLTHHLVHTEEIWKFSEKFLTEMAAGPIEIWTAKQMKRNG